MKPKPDRDSHAVPVGEPPPETRCVRMARPGVRACGSYLAGAEYDVPSAEAQRLVAHKGFVYVDGLTAPTPTNADQEH